jgi:hypothetical protein
MDAERAAEQLLTIRQLMERSALYRRALAPAMLLSGSLGVAAAALGCFGAGSAGPLSELGSPKGYFILWSGVACTAAVCALAIMRTQAWRAGELFWTPPAVRVAKAAAPPWIAAVGLLVAIGLSLQQTIEGGFRLVAASAPLWAVGHGLALHAAGFHTLRGVRLMGLAFVASGLAAALVASGKSGPETVFWSHMLMGVFFGIGHLGAGLFLRWDESRSVA